MRRTRASFVFCPFVLRGKRMGQAGISIYNVSWRRRKRAFSTSVCAPSAVSSNRAFPSEISLELLLFASNAAIIIAGGQIRARYWPYGLTAAKAEHQAHESTLLFFANISTGQPNGSNPAGCEAGGQTRAFRPLGASYLLVSKGSFAGSRPWNREMQGAWR